MNCEELYNQLPGYLDAELRIELCSELEQHIAECPYCRSHVHTMQGTVQLIHQIRPVAHEEWLQRLRERVIRRDSAPES